MKKGRGQTNQTCGNRLRQVCRQGQECRRWNIAHLEMASQEEFEGDGNIDYELEQIVYSRERNEKYVIRWKNMFHARTNNCIYISCRAWEIVLFPQQNLQQILSFELFFLHQFLLHCINILPVLPDVHTVLGELKSASMSLSGPTRYIIPQFSAEYFHALDSFLSDSSLKISYTNKQITMSLFQYHGIPW